MTPIYTRLAKCFAIVTMFSCLLLTATRSNAQTVTQAWATLNASALPHGIAIDGSGNIYVANRGNSTVSKITATGVVTQAWATLASGANPFAIALDGSGNLYTANNGNYTVSKITAAGVVTQAWASLGFKVYAYNIAVDAAGNVYTANSTTATVSKITAAGVVTPAWATLAAGAALNTVAVDASGNVYTANYNNNTVSKITPSGIATQTWATLATGAAPRSIAIDVAGNLYVANYGTSTVSKITAAGVVTQTWATLASGAGPFAIAVDAFGNVYTSNYNNNTVSKITAAGVVTQTWATLASGTTPLGLVTDVYGDVYTANAGNNTVSKISVPAITSFTPTASCAGATATLTITGTNLTGATAVTIGGTPVTSFTVNGATSITATVPANAAGAIVVTTPSGTAKSITNFGILNSYILTGNGSVPTGGKTILSVNNHQVVSYDTVNFSNQFNFNITTYNPILGGGGIAPDFGNTTTGVGTGLKSFLNVPYYIYPWTNTSNAWYAGAADTLVPLWATPKVSKPSKLSLNTQGKNIAAIDLLGNTLWGSTYIFNTVQFWSKGKIVFLDTLKGGKDTRDYLNNAYTNTVNGTTTTSIWNGVNQTGQTDRLDRIRIQLPTPSSIDSVLVLDSGAYFVSRLFVQAATVERVDTSTQVNVKWSDNSLTDTIITTSLSQPTIYTVTLSNSSASCTSSYTVNIFPTITSFTPTSSRYGTSTTIKIVGTHFTGTSALNIGGVSAISFTVINDSTITAIVPPFATGAIQLASLGGATTSIGTFTVLSPKVLTNSVTIPYGGSTSLSVDNNTVSSYLVLNLYNSFNFNITTYNATTAKTGGNVPGYGLGLGTTDTFNHVPFYIYPFQSNAVNGWLADTSRGTKPGKLTIPVNNYIGAVDLLANTIWGDSVHSYNTVQFWQGGKIIYKKALVGTQDVVRDKVVSGSNSINNTTTVTVWSDSATSFRLDAIKIKLPTASLVDSILVTDSGSYGVSRIFVIAATVEAATYNPAIVSWNTGATSDSITVSPTKTTTYSVTLNNSATDSLTVIVSPQATVTPSVSIAASATTVCLGGSYTFTATPVNGGAAKYAWYKNGVLVVSADTSGRYSYTSTTAKSDTIKAVLTSSLTNTTSTTATSNLVVVTTKAAPYVSALLGSSSICAGSYTSLYDSVFGGKWTSSATSIATIDSTGFVIGVSAGTSVISYTLTNASGCSAVATKTVTIGAKPYVSAIIGSSSIAVGSYTSLYDSVFGGKWTSSAASIATVDSTGFVIGVSAGTSVISYTLTNASGCTAVATKTVTITVAKVTPSVSIAASATTVCLGGSYTFTATPVNGGAAKYAWYKNGVLVVSADTSGRYSYTSTTAKSDTIKAVLTSSLTNTTSTTATSNLVVVTTTTKAAPYVSALLGSSSICAGSYTSLYDSATGGKWTSSAASIATIDSTGFVIGVSAGTSVISYTLTNASGCTAVATKTVTINAKPYVSAIIGSSSIAVGSYTSLYDSVFGGKWTSSATSVATVDSTGFVIGVSAGTSVIRYTLTNASGCTAVATKTVTITVAKVTPSVSIAASATNACLGSSYTFTATPVNGGGAKYAWYKNGVIVGGDSSASYTYTPTTAKADTINAVLTSSLTNVTTSTATSNIIVVSTSAKVAPSVSITASATSINNGASVTFTATGINGGDSAYYQWKKNGVNIPYDSFTVVTPLYDSFWNPIGSSYSDNSFANNDVITCVLTGNAPCVTTSTVTSNSIKLTVTSSCPTITSFLPTTGYTNEVDTIRGSGFTGVTAVNFGSVSASFTFVNDNTVTAVVPASVGTGIVSVTTPACSGSKGVFTLVRIPTVGAVNKVGGSQYFCINGPTVYDSAVASAPSSISKAFTWYKTTNAGNNSSYQIVGHSQVYSFLPSSFGVGNYYLPLQFTATYPDGTQITVWDPYSLTAEIDGIPTLGKLGGNSSVALNGSNPLSANGASVGSNELNSGIGFQWFSNTTNSTKNATYIGAGGVQSPSYSGLGGLQFGYPYINPSYSTSGTYYYFCVVTGTCGATDTSNIIPVTVLPATASAVDIAEITSESTGLQSNLYPNPSHGAATLALKGVKNKVKVTITGLTGNLVGIYEVNADSKLQLPSDKLATGLYIISINDGTTKKTLKWANLK